MKREEWLAAGVLAAAVALAVVAAGLPPMGWAEDSARAAIPALPPAELKIPSLSATIKATAERKPGEVVVVNLSCEGAEAHSGETVPLVVQVFRIDPREMMSRVALPKPRQAVAGVSYSLLIEASGKGHASVELPLTWASEDAAAPVKGKLAASYYLLLSSPLAPVPVTLPSPSRVAPKTERKAGS
jgi:hypothetical protein